MTTSININLAEKTLSDTMAITSETAFTLGGTIAKTVCGQAFSFTVASYRWDHDIGLYAASCDYGLKKLLGKDYSKSLGTRSAEDILGDLASSMDLSSSKKLSFDWTPTGIVSKKSSTYDYCETYGSALEKVCGWTDIVPSLLVNVFIRGGTMYCVQRGNEVGTVTASKYAALKREYSKMDLIYSSDKDYYLCGQSDKNIDTSVDTPTESESLVSGQFTDMSGQRTLSYTSGLLTSEKFTSTDATVSSTSTYTYNTLYPPANLLTKTLTRVEQPDNSDVPTPTTDNIPIKVITKKTDTSSVTNTMDDFNTKNLLHSSVTTSTTTEGYNIVDVNGTQVAFTDTVSSTTDTYYSDMGQGQWSVTTYKDGNLTGDQVVTGNPGATATPYAIKHTSTRASKKGGSVKSARVKLSGRFSGSMSVNVSDKDSLEDIASAIESLNGKTQERISFTCYDTSVLFDFLHTVTLGGIAYYLVGNNITWTAKDGIAQHVTAVRWY